MSCNDKSLLLIFMLNFVMISKSFHINESMDAIKNDHFKKALTKHPKSTNSEKYVLKLRPT